MTTNYRAPTEREFFDQGYAAGYAACEAKMMAYGKLHLLGGTSVLPPALPSAPTPHKPAVKAAAATKPAKAPVIARGVKKAAAPHSKGVKEGIVKHLGEAGLATVPVIIAKLGFKESSVRATLMALKKKGIASSEAGVWSLTADARQSGGYGNSEASTQQPPF